MPAPKRNQAGLARKLPSLFFFEDVDARRRPRAIARTVSDPWMWGTGPRGSRSSYPVHDHAIRVLGSESKLCKQNRREPRGRAPRHALWENCEFAEAVILLVVEGEKRLAGETGRVVYS